MPEEVIDIMEGIIAKGYEVYIVGGYVRDYLLNIKSDDYDLATNMPLDKLKEIYPKLHIMKENNHRNTSVLHINNKKIEISSFKGKNIKEDLQNRDYTINAMALDINKKIIDIYGGQEDLNNKILKLVKDDGSGIDYDPIRILRAIRLALTHNFKIDMQTKNILLAKKDLLNTVAKERILSEFLKIICCDKASSYIDEYKEIFFIIIPELKEIYHFEQHNEYHIYDVFYHTLKVLENVENNKYLRLAAIFHDIGKPEKFFIDEKNVGHFYGHWESSARIFKDFCKTYKIDHLTEEIVTMLIINHDRSLPVKKKSIIKFLQEFNPVYLDLLVKIKEADILAQNPKFASERLKELKENTKRIQEVIEEKPVLTTKDILISGKELLKLGYQGKEIGKIKNMLLELINNEKLTNNPEAIINYLKK